MARRDRRRSKHRIGQTASVAQQETPRRPARATQDHFCTQPMASIPHGLRGKTIPRRQQHPLGYRFRPATRMACSRGTAPGRHQPRGARAYVAVAANRTAFSWRRTYARVRAGELAPRRTSIGMPEPASWCVSFPQIRHNNPLPLRLFETCARKRRYPVWPPWLGPLHLIPVVPVEGRVDTRPILVIGEGELYRVAAQAARQVYCLD